MGHNRPSLSFQMPGRTDSVTNELPEGRAVVLK